MSEKFKKALRIAVNVGCGFEGDAEDAAELLTLIVGLESQIAELKAETKALKENSQWLARLTESSRKENEHLRQTLSVYAAKQRWIPVSERLPEAKGHYMAVVVDGFDDSRSVETLRYFGDRDWFTWSDWYVVTHWKEKPELPEVTE